MKVYHLLVADIVRTFGWRLLGLYGLTVFIGVTEGLGVAMLFPLLTQLGIAGSTQNSPLVEIVDAFTRSISPSHSLIPLLAMLIAIFVVQAVVYVVQNWWVALYQRRYSALWQQRLFTAFVEAEWSFLSRHKSGELLNAINVETVRLANAFYSLSQLVATVIVATVYLMAAFFVSWKVTLILTAAAVVLAFSTIRLVRKSYDIGVLVGPLNARLSVMVGEYLSGIRIVKSSIAENFVIARANDVFGRIEAALRMATFLPHLVRGIFELICLIILVLLLVIAPNYLGVAPANLMVVMALFLRLFPRLMTLQRHIHDLNAFAPAIEMVTRLALDAEAHKEPRLENGFSPPAYSLPTNLKVDHVDVRYGNEKILSDVSMSFPVPGVTAVVGESGAGKSTLINVLAGLVRTSKGSVSLGDIRLQNTPLRSWRGLFGYVSQEASLFHLTLRENISFALPDCPLDQVQAVAHRANADKFISKLPLKYDTPAGDQGGRLSGGERQRIAIARALLKNPAILLLDEPTSSLDSDTEKAVLDTVDELRKEAGIVIIAHRLATVRNADMIYVLDGGRVVEQGSWEDLIHQNGRFAELAQQQNIDSA